VTIREEDEPTDRVVRGAQVRANRSGAVRERGVEGQREIRDPAPVRVAVADDEEARHGRRLPAELRDDVPAEPSTPIDRGEDLARVDHIGLVFALEQGAMARVPRHGIDDAALAVVREGMLGPDFPARSGSEPPDDRLRQGRMARVHHSIEVGASRTRKELQADLEHAAHGTERPELHRLEVAPFQSRDHRCRDLRSVGEVFLTPAAADARCSDCRADPQIVHSNKHALAPFPRAYSAACPNRY
jgi:hypothetical protein